MWDFGISLCESGITSMWEDLRDEPNAYKPHTISLGLHDPFFCGYDPHPYEVKKKELLQHRLPQGSHFNSLVDSMMRDPSRILQWYCISDDPDLRGMCSMMAVDGIFLLEFLREISSPRGRRHAITNQEVQEDILKLQNQIPIFALKMIIQWKEETNEYLNEIQETNEYLNEILKRAWHSLSPFYVGEEPLKFPEENEHLLGFVYENILGDRTDLPQYNGEGNQKKTLPARAVALDNEGNQKKTLPARAVALDNKGVKFAAYTGPLNKIRFDRTTWKFHLPRIKITARTDAVMRNLVAFELFGCEGQTKPMKCYVELMDQLINTAEDVEVLIKRGIINHHLGSDQEVADIWNKMREGHDQNGKYGPIDTAIDAVIKFYGGYRIWFSEGVKKFFSKPWLVVSFIAGCIIVITAIVQTIFSGLQLHHH